MDPNTASPVIRMLVLGDQSVGKTSIVKAYRSGVGLTPETIADYSPTIGIELTSASFHHVQSKSDIEIKIFDSSGRDRYLNIDPLSPFLQHQGAWRKTPLKPDTGEVVVQFEFEIEKGENSAAPDINDVIILLNDVIVLWNDVIVVK